MNRTDKRLTRVAVDLHEQLGSDRSPPARIELPNAAWQQAETFLQRIHRARKRGWFLASQRLVDELRCALQRLRNELTTLCDAIQIPLAEAGVASVADICADLTALHEEFGDVDVDLRCNTISVTTEPIDLEGICLGPFEICLDGCDLVGGHPRNYRVIALDPNPAASNETVTHPHVQDDAVCEGEGHQLIRNALEQGRLLDFFLIVSNLLRSYNSNSPYVSLSDWHGVDCTDCGTTVCENERWACEKCEAWVCGECYFSCSDCDGVYCATCVVQCARCEEYSCSSCSCRCARCQQEVCPDCLNQNERCSDCHDQETEESNDPPINCEQSSRAGTAGASV